MLAGAIAGLRPDATIRGIEVLPRPVAAIEIEEFDGKSIPYPDGSFDVVMLVDVLHHTPDPASSLAEAVRVSRRSVLIKDHLSDGFLARPTLRFMDQVGNARYGVSLPYNYWPKSEWLAAFDKLSLRTATWNEKPRLYQWPASMVFGRSLHFISLLNRT